MNNFANTCVIIKNGQMAKLKHVIVPFSNLIISFLKLLKEKGYINDYVETLININHKKIKVFLKYYKKGSVINNLVLISKPSIKIYKQSKFLQKKIGENGLLILSTSKGLMTSLEAKKNNLGGELICYVD